MTRHESPSLAAPSFEASVSYRVTQPMHNLFNSFGLLSVRGVYGIKLPLPTPWLKQCTKIRVPHRFYIKIALIHEAYLSDIHHPP